MEQIFDFDIKISLICLVNLAAPLNVQVYLHILFEFVCRYRKCTERMIIKTESTS